MRKASLVSIIIPAYNSASLIKNTVSAALNQIYPNIEVIVVDDGSNDNIQDVLKSFSGVFVIKQVNSGPATARNTGANAAKGEYLFFTDSDCEPALDWIEVAMKGFSRDEIGVVAGSYGIANPKNLLACCIHNEIMFRHTYLMPDYPKSFGSYNFGIRRALFEQIGGFNTEYRNASGEDNDLSYKVIKSGFRIYFERASKVNHLHPERLGAYLKSQFNHGFWRVKMYKDHPQMMRGDDYTFWKDILEVLLAGIMMLCMLVSLFTDVFLTIMISIAIVLFVIELYFAFRMGNNIREKLMLSIMTFLRSFYRTIGFSAGILCLLSGGKKRK